MSADPLSRIHHIDPRFNRLFSAPLYLFSCVAVCLCFVLPYLGRLFFALLINLFFNRPLVYLSYFARLVARPLNAATTALLYLVLLGVYALPLKLWEAIGERVGRAEDRSGWRPAGTATNRDTARYQS